MKIESITEVKKRFTQIVRELPETGMVVVTKDGRPAAVVMQVTEDTDLETLALSSNARFWKLWDRSLQGGATPLEEIPIDSSESAARAKLVELGLIAADEPEKYGAPRRASKRRPRHTPKRRRNRSTSGG